ncbi:MAG: hypothetical protein ABJH63_10230 [Rhizobiaceae bacterium]
MALTNNEVALIKRMLQDGMQNAAIQFYFNRPDRMVNNGRISEIKAGNRGEDISAASRFEVAEFIDTHPLTSAEKQEQGEAELPRDEEAATQFTILDDETVDFIADPPEYLNSEAQDQTELHSELAHKVHVLLELGENALGTIHDPVRRFSEAIRVDPNSASITQIWTRGNSLRAALSAHDKSEELDEYALGRLEPMCAESLRDLVETYNVFIIGDPKGMQLDRERLGPLEFEKQKKSLDEIGGVLAATKDFSTEGAYEQIERQLANALESEHEVNGEQAVKVASNTSTNLFFTLIRRGIYLIKETLQTDFSDFLSKFRKAGYYVVGAHAVAAWPPAMTFLANNLPDIHKFLKNYTVNDSVLFYLEVIAKFFG